MIGIPNAEFTGLADLICIGFFSTCWLLLHIIFVILCSRRSRNPRVHDESLRDPKNKLCDNTVVPPLRIENAVTRKARNMRSNIARSVATVRKRRTASSEKRMAVDMSHYSRPVPNATNESDAHSA